MAKLSIKKGTTSKSTGILIQDSSRTDGGGLINLLNNTVGLIAYWYQPGITAPAAITLNPISAITSAYVSGGFKEADPIHMKGHYRFDIPNICLAGGSDVIIELSGASNMVPCRIEIELTATDNQDAINGGMSALPHTACATNASLITSLSSIATAVWTDTTSSDFTVSGSIGQILHSGSSSSTFTEFSYDIKRTSNDTNSIFFQWTSSTATITATKSINGGSYTSVTGAINYLRVDGAAFVYEFIYNSADRPSSGSVIYEFTDGTSTKVLILEIVPIQDIATLILGATASSWNTIGTIGHAINAAGTAADPWTTALPGSYAAGSAGYIIGHFASATDPWSVSVPGSFPSGTAGYILGNMGAYANPWDIPIPGSFTTGKAGNILGNLLSNLFSTVLPGSYTGGQFGYIIGHNIDNTISSRPTSTQIATAVWASSTGVIVNGYASGQSPATLVLGAAASSWNTVGTIGNAINSTTDPWLTNVPGSYSAGTAGYILGHSSSATDPWATVLPGSYAGNQAGYIVGHNINATISSRATTGPVIVGGYVSGFDPATFVLGATASAWNTAGTIGSVIQTGTSITTDEIWGALLGDPGFYVDGSIGQSLKNFVIFGATLALSQAVPIHNTPNTIGDCLNAARVQAFGNWNLDRDSKILTLYGSDNSIVWELNVDSITAPTNRAH